MKNNPLVSVVVPTKNSAKYLEASLRSLNKQTYKNTEIIVVDNYSEDSTLKIAKKYTNKVFSKGPERTAQVNYGIEIADGKYAYYTGSDLDRDADLIEQAVEMCENSKCDFIYLNVKTKITNANIWQKVRSLERELYYKEPGMCAARFYNRKLFLKLRGLDESLGGVSDDLEFQHRINIAGYKTCFIDANEYNLAEYDSIGIIIKRSLYYGWLIKRYINKHPSKTQVQYKPIRNEFLKKNKILLKDKFLFIMFVIYKLTQYLFGGIGLVLAKISKDNKRIEKYLFNLNYHK